jgi:predicted DNA-binding transcriptional regulator YafY
LHRSDRLLGIMLQLSQGGQVSARELAERFEVSLRTIYRDIDALGELGVPVYAETGRNGGFRLLEGYFLPPVMFSEGEAISIILGAALLRSLRVHPFASRLDAAEEKLLAAVPPRLRDTLQNARRIIGFEEVPINAFHEDRQPRPGVGDTPAQHDEARVIDMFLSAILTGSDLAMRYHTPYRPGGSWGMSVTPTGMFWDSDYWYLIGRSRSPDEGTRTWRADRVLEIRPIQPGSAEPPAFDIHGYLGRKWLDPAMRDWAREAPVKVLLSSEQARRLQRDWYYGHAIYEEYEDGRILMTFGQDDPAIVMELIRWLGPGAELLHPHAWRATLREELRELLTVYEEA